MESPIIAIFKDDLKSVQFQRNGEVVDPRAVLGALAAGSIVVKHEREMGTYGDDVAYGGVARYIKSETFSVVPRTGE